MLFIRASLSISFKGFQVKLVPYQWHHVNTMWTKIFSNRSPLQMTQKKEKKNVNVSFWGPCESCHVTIHQFPFQPHVLKSTDKKIFWCFWNMTYVLCKNSHACLLLNWAVYYSNPEKPNNTDWPLPIKESLMEFMENDGNYLIFMFAFFSVFTCLLCI